MHTSYYDVDSTNERWSFKCWKSTVHNVLKMASPFESDTDSSDFEGFPTVSATTGSVSVENYSDISVSSVETDDLSGLSSSSDEESPPHSGRNLGTPVMRTADTWKSTIVSTTKPSFCGPCPGPVAQMGPDSREIDFFNLFFGGNMIDVSTTDQMILSIM